MAVGKIPVLRWESDIPSVNIPQVERKRGRRRDSRPSAARRGYDRGWSAMRARVLAEEPLCRMCKRAGRVKAAAMLDHILPIRVRPKLRLERSNLQPLCVQCHAVKTARDRKYYGGLSSGGWQGKPKGR